MQTKLILSLLVAVSIAARAEELTESQAVAEALRNNPELHALAARIEAAERGVPVARQFANNPEIVFEEGLDRHIGVSQTFEWPGKRFLREVIARQDVETVRIGLEWFKTSLAAEVRQRFVETLAAQKLIDVQQRGVEAAETILSTARKRVEGGFALTAERTQADVELVRARRQLRDAQKSASLAGVAFNQLLGRDALAPVAVAGELTLPAEEPVTEIGRHPQLRLQRAEVEKRRLNTKLAGKEGAPDITVEPFYEYNPKNTGENKIGVGVTLPLPLWKTSRPAVALARAEEHEAAATLAKTEREVLAGIAKAHAEYAAARDSAALFTDELQTQLEEQLGATRHKYADGQVSFLALLEIQRSYFDYLKERYESLVAARTALAELEKAAAISAEERK